MDPKPAPKLPALKLIAFALTFSVVIFSCIAAVFGLNRKTPPPFPNINLFYIILAVAGVPILGSLAIFGSVYIAAVRKQWQTCRDQPSAGDWLLNQFAVLTILRLACLEGWGLLGATGVFLTGQWPMLAAPAISVLLMLTLAPSEDKVRTFITRVTGQTPQ